MGRRRERVRVASTPRIVHFDGASWSDVYDGASNGEHATFHDVWSSGENDVWFVGDVGLVLHWDGTSFSFAEVGGANDPVYAVGGTGANDVWIVGALGGNRNQFHHFDGSAWTTVFTDSNGGYEVSSVYAASTTNAWAAGVEGAPAYVFDGATWAYADAAATHALQNSLQVWGSSGSDVWTVGEYGSVQHYDGTAWSPVALTSDTVVGVSGTGPLDAWMVTSAGAILHHP